MVNLYNQFDINVTDVAPVQAPWVPLDETLLTPMCRYKNILPCIFPPVQFVSKKNKGMCYLIHIFRKVCIC